MGGCAKSKVMHPGYPLREPLVARFGMYCPAISLFLGPIFQRGWSVTGASVANPALLKG